MQRLAVGLVLLTTACGFLPLTHSSRVGADVIEAAAKPTPVDSMFDSCGPDGAQPDYQLNRKKNRIDDSPSFTPVPWSVIAKLPWPRQVGFRFRNQFTKAEQRDVARYEGAALSVEGYVVGYRLEVPEPPNCYERDAAHKDYHIWLSETPNGKRSQSVVVEITPRVRPRHPAWTEQQLADLVASQARIRVSGWLMLDEMHPEKVGGNRVTLWEIHPVMRLEVQNALGSWVSL